MTAKQMKDKWSQRDIWLPQIGMTKVKVDENISYLRSLKDNSSAHERSKKVSLTNVNMIKVRRILKERKWERKWESIVSILDWIDYRINMHNEIRMWVYSIKIFS